MFTFTRRSSSPRSSAIRSSTGETAWHGPHHSAQKSTSTGSSLWSTSSSNVFVVTAFAIPSFRRFKDGSVPDPPSCRTLVSTLLFPMAPVFQPLPATPDHVELEHEVLGWWDDERIFERLREQNRGGPTFSFIDGPITANNPMGVHHCWGRTLKDVFQRYKASHGYEQRYQNGFDCQGLWVEVEVEKALGLNSKHEIEEYGLAEFAARCKERVAKFSE